MENFKIDFIELSILAEACIPPRPIARAMFWQNLTKVYWEQMSEPQRAHIFNWLQRNPYYSESLKNEVDTKIFHARFDPDNQYMVRVKKQVDEQEYRTFKRAGSEEEGFSNRYYVGHDTYIPEEYIVEVKKFTPKT
jgi:hypothetical protein